MVEHAGCNQFSRASFVLVLLGVVEDKAVAILTVSPISYEPAGHIIILILKSIDEIFI